MADKQSSDELSSLASKILKAKPAQVNHMGIYQRAGIDKPSTRVRARDACDM